MPHKPESKESVRCQKGISVAKCGEQGEQVPPVLSRFPLPEVRKGEERCVRRRDPLRQIWCLLGKVESEPEILPIGRPLFRTPRPTVELTATSWMTQTHRNQLESKRVLMAHPYRVSRRWFRLCFPRMTGRMGPSVAMRGLWDPRPRVPWRRSVEASALPHPHGCLPS